MTVFSLFPHRKHDIPLQSQSATVFKGLGGSRKKFGSFLVFQCLNLNLYASPELSAKAAVKNSTSTDSATESFSFEYDRIRAPYSAGT
jgi:hypothetical protein